MKLLDQKTENHQVLLTVELEQAEVETSKDEAYQRLVKRTDIPGFRKGKAPREILERHLGPQAVFDDAMQDLIPKTCFNIIDEQKIDIYASPSIRMTKTDPVTFEAVVPLRPEITLGDYNAIKMKPPAAEIKEEDVDKVVNRLRKQCATWEDVDKAAAFGDVVVIDIDSNIGDSPYISEKGAQFQIVAGGSFPVKGFSEQLEGMSKGEEKEFRLTFAEDYPDKDKAGKEVSFKVKLIGIQEEKLPELNDDFVKNITPEIKTLAELRERIKNDLTQRAEDNIKMDFEDKVVDALVEKSQIEFPPFLVEAEIDNMIEQYYERVRRSVGSQEEFDQIINMSPREKLSQNYHDQAVQRVKRSLVIAKIVDTEKYETSDAEIDDYIEKLTADAGAKREEQKEILNSEDNRENIRRWMTMRKAVLMLVEKAQSD
jgi:trigger factor